MTQLSASIAIGTAAALLATLLLLLRATFQGRRQVLVLIRRWIGASTRTSTIVLTLLSAIAIFCFANVSAIEGAKITSASAPNAFANATSTPSIAFVADETSIAGKAVESLRDYAAEIETKPQSAAATAPEPNPAEVPAVDTMIAKLVARLEKQPDDVTGWKTLGWSYLNTDRPEQAARAYETALKLKPGDTEIKKGLEDAKLALAPATQVPSAAPASSPTAEDIKSADGLSDAQRNTMIRDMVDQLATRLETSPNDEEGWLRLLRSRMTLGERDAAKAALAKALEFFSSDDAAKERLTATARELGVESN